MHTVPEEAEKALLGRKREHGPSGSLGGARSWRSDGRSFGLALLRKGPAGAWASPRKQRELLKGSE